MMFGAIANGGALLKPQIVKPEFPEVRNEIPMPSSVRHTLLDGLYRVVNKQNGLAHPFKIRTLYQYPLLIKGYKKLQGQMIGKSSTAELSYHPHLDREGPSILRKDIWFGAISYNEEFRPTHYYREADPELVVVVYLRSGDYGKEAAPLCAEIINKWREIQLSHSTPECDLSSL